MLRWKNSIFKERNIVISKLNLPRLGFSFACFCCYNSWLCLSDYPAFIIITIIIIFFMLSKYKAAVTTEVTNLKVVITF